MELEEAIDFPRFLWDGAGGVTVEDGYQGTSGLRMRHESIRYPGATGVAQGVQVMKEALKGVCDVRGEGLPFGS
jgi:gamma-glutamyltranspeptidase